MRGDLIVRSFEIAAERCADLTPPVYTRLFRDHPQMERLFWRDTQGNVRGEMLARVIEAILDFVGPRYYAQTLIQCEVVTHEGYDVPPDVFGTFFATVAATLRDICAADWTAAMDAAWRETLAALDFYVTHPINTRRINPPGTPPHGPLNQDAEMAEPKTKPTTASVKAFLDTVPDEGMRKDAKALAKIFAEVTGEKAVMWGAAIVGFGSYMTKSGTWPLTAFSPRKSDLTLYVGAKRQAALLTTIGKHRVGGGCLYLKRLSDADPAVLREAIANSYAHAKAANPA